MYATESAIARIAPAINAIACPAIDLPMNVRLHRIDANTHAVTASNTNDIESPTTYPTINAMLSMSHHLVTNQVQLPGKSR
jgi:hypothetical protein